MNKIISLALVDEYRSKPFWEEVFNEYHDFLKLKMITNFSCVVLLQKKYFLSECVYFSLFWY